jgi:hypothetical protein
MEGDFRDKLNPLRIGGVIDTSLEDAATMTVCSDLNTVGGHSVVDKLVILGNETVQTLLNHVVSIQVLDQGDYVQAQRENDASNLVGLPRVAEEIDHFLDSSSTVHVQGDSDKVVCD